MEWKEGLRSFICIWICALALTGCASSVELGYRAYNNHQYREAAKHFYTCAKAGNAACATQLGVIHHKYGNEQKAVELFTLAARMGEPTAAENLQILGYPVPNSDLAQNSAQNSGVILPLLNAIISGYNDSARRNNNQQQRRMVYCDTVVNGRYADTMCF